MTPKISAIEKARRAWGAELPDWVEQLAMVCDRSSMNAAAARLEVSNGVVSQVLNAKYPGNLKRVETTVRGRLMNATVVCPVVGELAIDQCQTHQKRKRVTCHEHLMFWRACRGGCPNSFVQPEEA